MIKDKEIKSIYQELDSLHRRISQSKIAMKPHRKVSKKLLEIKMELVKEFGDDKEKEAFKEFFQEGKDDMNE